MKSVRWSQALAWRLRRHLLDPVGTASVPEVVRRLGGVQSQVASSADLAIRLRRQRSAPGEVDRALESGRLIKTWAMRSALHLLTPEEGGDILSLLAAGRGWEKPSWDRYFGMSPRRWDVLRAAARDALADGPLTRQELGAAVAVGPELGHLREHFDSSWGTILKPLAFQGDLSIGPPRDGRATMQLLDRNPRWAGLHEPSEAAIRVLETYYRAYGPATVDNVYRWSGAAKRAVMRWHAALGDRLVAVEIDGEPAHLLRDDLDELASTPATTAVRLLPGFDQWVLGPGTLDRHVLPPARRKQVSRQAGWIAPIVVVGGVISGTWAVTDDQVVVDWFGEIGPVPRRRLGDEVDRVAATLGRTLRLTIRTMSP